MAENAPPGRPGLRAAFSNWRESDAPLLAKLRLLARNSWTKLRTRSNCCGNQGQPGC
jgi:hypothetical protein